MRNTITNIMKRTTAAIALVIAFGLWGSTSNAQTVASYGFTQALGTYTPIVGTVVTGSTAACDDNNFALVPIGFTFGYAGGLTYTNIGISANGYARLGAVTTTTYAGGLSTQANSISMLGADLYGLAAGHDIQYLTTGVVGSRVFTVQYKNWGTYASGLSEYNWQLKLYETTNVIQIVYGSFAGASTAGSRQVGLRGVLATDFQNRTGATWLGSTPGGLVTTLKTIGVGNVPGTGLTYTWTPSLPCAGAPAAAVAAGPASVCAATNFNLTSTGYTSGSGISYQWQVDASGGCGTSWVNIPAATNPNLVTTTQLVASCYRLNTTCSNSGLTTPSNTVGPITMNLPTSCYCASASASTADEEIFNVSIGSLNNTSNCASVGPGPGSVNSMYSNYTTLPATSLFVGSTYTLSLNLGMCGTFAYTGSAAAWIDYNQNGLFTDPGEKIYTGPYVSHAIAGTIETGLVTIPAATLGNTRMRVSFFESPTQNPCGTTSTWGEVEDYTITIAVPVACSGTPATNTATASPALNVCPATNIALGSTGLVPALNYTYQWQINNTATGSVWVNLPAAGINLVSGTFTSAALTINNQTVTSQYRCLVTCTNSGLTGIANAVTVTEDIIANCYCASSATSTFDEEIFNVTLNTLNNSSICGTLAPGAGSVSSMYSNYKTLPATSLNISDPYSISMTLGYCNGTSYTAIAGAYIDFNSDGDFGDFGENIYTTPYQNFAVGGTVMTGAFVVDPSAVAGPTVLRVVYVESNVVSPCGTYTWGETEDYSLNLVALPPCAGAPTPGTVNSSDPSPCSGIPFTLSVTGATTGLGGIQNQWQTSTTGCGGTWTDLPLGTGATYLYTFPGAQTREFRRRMICTFTSDTVYSSCLTLTSTLCYCAPSHTIGTGTGFFINRVEVEGAGMNNTTGPTLSAPWWDDLTGTVAPATIMINAPYWINVETGTNLATHDVGVWIDFNQNGLFGAGEYITGNSLLVPGGGGALGTGHFFFTVPAAGTLTGVTRMRVRASGGTSVTLDPCLNTAPNYATGESEDYAINIIANACLTPTQAGFITGITPQLTVANDFIDVNVSGGVGTLTGYEIDWTAPYDFLPPNNTLTNYGGTFIANVNPGVPTGFIYIRGKYQNGGCPVDYSNPDFVKLECASSCTNNTNDNDYIAGVSLGSTPALNNVSTFDATLDGYQNFLASGPYHVSRAVNIPIQLTMTPFWSEGARVWIDYNGDGILSSTESVYADAVAASGVHPAGTINIPCGDGYVGPAKMRVMCTFAGIPNVDPCFGAITGARGYGEIEEYTVYIDDVQDLVVNPTNAVCIGQTATLNGTGPAGTTNWQWSPTNTVNGVVMNPANGAAATVTVQTTSPSNVFFTVTGTLSNGCTSYNIVPVATTPLAGTVSPAGSIICSGTTKFLTATGAAGDYQWQSSLDNITWTDIPGATNGLNYTTAAAAVNKYYRLLSKSVPCWDIASNTALVEIAATPVVTFSNVTATSATVNWTPVGGGSYTIGWTGAGTGSTTSATPPVNLLGLTPNTNLSVTVTLTNPPACAGVSAGTATTKTLCAAPPAPSFGAITTTTAVVNIPAGTTSYKVFYKLIQISNTYLSSGVLAGGSTFTIYSQIGAAVYPGAALSVYLQAWDCPTVGLSGQAGPSVIQYLSPGTSTCPTPSFTLLSDCSNRIKVTLSGNPTNAYRVTFRRLLPSVAAPNTYNFTGTTLNYTVLNTPLPQVWEVYAISTCGASYGQPWSVMSQVQQIQVKGGCLKVNNLVLSHPTCHGFTASWNVGDCGAAPGLTGYTVFTKEGASQWNGYASLTNVKSGNIWASGSTILVYVRANSCNGSFGPASDIQTITTLSGVGCREEDQQADDENLFGNGVTNEFGTMSLFPNPNSGQFNMDLQMSDMTAQDVRVEIVNMLGQAVLTQITSINDGHLTESVEMPENITSGSYMVRVIVGDNAIFNSQVNISK